MVEAMRQSRSAGVVGVSRPVSVSPDDEEEFRVALGRYRARSGRMFPTWTEILEVLRELGYAKRVWRPIEPGPAPRT